MRIIPISEEDFFERALAEMQWADDGGNVALELDYAPVQRDDNLEERFLVTDGETGGQSLNLSS